MSENSNYVHVHDGSSDTTDIGSYTYSGTTAPNTGGLYVDGQSGSWYGYRQYDYNYGKWDEYVYPDYVGVNKMIDKIKKENEDMRYLYEVILVNPKNDTFYMENIVARSDTSALIEVYDRSTLGEIAFDDLEVSCRRLMEWKKEKSLTKAIKTIQDAVE